MDRKILILIFVIIVIYAGSSQFGFQSIAGSNFFPNKNIERSIQPASSLHYSLGLSYWMRLKFKRIEFNPALIFDYSKANYSKIQLSPISLTEYSVSFNMPILIYPLDFNNDCNCPTFNKKGQFFEKGFYFLIYPAIPYSLKKLSNMELSDSKSVISFQLGLGAGIDIGINKKWTISPSLMLSNTFSDLYSYDINNQVLFGENDSRYRLDLMLRFIWFSKKKRY